MSLCLTENVLVTIGMFCDGWVQHIYAQIVQKHAIPKCPNAQIVPTDPQIISRARFLCHIEEATMLCLVRSLIVGSLRSPPREGKA